MMRRSIAPLLCATSLGLSACGSPPPSATALLTSAKQAVDSSSSVHFTLSSSDVQGAGNTYLVGGNGNAKRPDAFAGSLNVSIDGIILSIKIASVSGAFYVQMPFSTKWERADPTKYGFGDPGQLIDRDHGLSSLLAKAKSPTVGDRDRYNGELLDEVHCTIPGPDVARLLTSADSNQDDTAVIAISVDSHQLRRVVLTGPFFSKTQMSTYTLILDHYGEGVAITPPPT